MRKRAGKKHMELSLRPSSCAAASVHQRLESLSHLCLHCFDVFLTLSLPYSSLTGGTSQFIRTVLVSQ